MVYLTQYTPNAVISMCDGEPPAGSLSCTQPLSCPRACPRSAQPRSAQARSQVLSTAFSGPRRLLGAEDGCAGQRGALGPGALSTGLQLIMELCVRN